MTKGSPSDRMFTFLNEGSPSGDNIIKRIRGSLKATWQLICSDLLLAYDWWHDKGAFFFYISRSSLMSSFSSPVKTSSQQFRSVCLSEILGISHDMYIHAIFLGIPFLLLLTHSVLWDQFIALGCTLTALYYFLLHESWQVLQGILSESVLIFYLCHVIMIATY